MRSQVLRTIAVMLPAIMIIACNKTDTPPTSETSSQSQGSTPNRAASTSTYTAGEEPATEEVEDDEAEVLRIRRKAQWEKIHRALREQVYATATERDTTHGGDDSTYVYWETGSIHLVNRGADTLILATFNRLYGRRPHHIPGYMDLVAATLKNGKFTIIDTVAYVQSGEFGNPRVVNEYALHRDITPLDPHDVGGTGFTRFGKNTWGWIVSDYGAFEGEAYHTVRIYALDATEIRNLGAVKVGERKKGPRRGTFSAYNSSIVVMNDEHPSISDLSIIWFESPNGRDTYKRVTFHPYVPGKGYDFAGLGR